MVVTQVARWKRGAAGLLTGIWLTVAACGQVPARIDTGSDWLEQAKVLKNVDMWNRMVTIEDPADGTEKTINFEYTSEGAPVMGVVVAPDQSIWGGAAFPMSFQFSARRFDILGNRIIFPMRAAPTTQNRRKPCGATAVARHGVRHAFLFFAALLRR